MASRVRKKGVRTSGFEESWWMKESAPLLTQPLAEDLDVDVVIVGAGIAGMSVAYFLSQSGKKVAVIEDGAIGSGETGRTTAHLTYALDDRYTAIKKTHGKGGALRAAQSHKAAIQLAEFIVKREGIDCDFYRVPGYLFLDPEDKTQTLEDELKVLKEVGFREVKLVRKAPLPFNTGPALLFPDQAYFHPLKYLKGLGRAITERGGKIFTQTHASEIDQYRVQTSNGHSVWAKHVVVTTNTPVHDRVTMHTKQAPYRTFVIAGPVPKGAVKPGLYWDTGRDAGGPTRPYHYVRVAPYTAKQDLLIVGGEDHKTGQNDDANFRYAQLKRWTQSKFPMRRVLYQWSGQVMEPTDQMAYIGKNPSSQTYIATGDSGNGITHGIIAGLLIRDLILGKPNPWKKLYNPARKPLRTAGAYMQENLNVANRYVDWIRREDVKSLRGVGREQGAIVQSGLSKLAIFKDAKGRLHRHSAVCPHLGCVVQWNSGEKTFDCPCHGSRFTPYGKVINGPANRGLYPPKKNDLFLLQT